MDGAVNGEVELCEYQGVHMPGERRAKRMEIQQLETTNYSCVLENLEPFISQQVETLLRYKRLGIGAGHLTISELKRSSCNNSKKNDRFKLRVPYGGCDVSMDVIWYPNNISLAPDFIFDDEQFSNFLLYEDVHPMFPSLEEWDIDVETSLHAVMMDVMAAYRLYQTNELESSGSPLLEEVNTLVETLQLKEDSVEVVANRTEENYVSVMIELPLSYADILPRASCAKDWVVALLVMFPTNVVNQGVQTELFLSPFLKEAAGALTDLSLPCYASYKGLVDYVLSVTHQTNSQLKEIYVMRRKKNEFMRALFSHLGGGGSKLKEVKRGLNSMEVCTKEGKVKVKLSDTFPDEGPEVLVGDTNLSFTYSAEWDCEKMATEIKNAVDGHFQNGTAVS